jgi:hypothetical protein
LRSACLPPRADDNDGISSTSFGPFPESRSPPPHHGEKDVYHQGALLVGQHRAGLRRHRARAEHLPRAARHHRPLGRVVVIVPAQLRRLVRGPGRGRRRHPPRPGAQPHHARRPLRSALPRPARLPAGHARAHQEPDPAGARAGELRRGRRRGRPAGPRGRRAPRRHGR